MRLALVSLAALAALTPGAARASYADYAAARVKTPPEPASATAAVLTTPSQWHGSVVEAIGMVIGTSRTDGASCLLVRTAGGQTVVLQAPAETELPAMGSAVRALARASQTGRFDLLAVVNESEVPAAAPVVKPAAQTPQAAPQTRATRYPSPGANRSSYGSRGSVDISAYIPAYSKAVRSINSRLSVAEANRIARSIVTFAYQNGIDARLVMAIVATESGFRPGATSHAGAMGLSQLMPGTARSLGVRNGYNIEQNIAGASKLLRSHIDKYAGKGDDWFKLVCAAYNAGPGAVRRYGGVPPYRETRNYVQKVNAWYRVFAPEMYRR